MPLNPNTDNPFSASRLRPGAVEFLFDGGDSLADVLNRLERHQGWGQIRGPHGSGKSTLLEALTPGLQAAGRRVVRFTLRQGERRLIASAAEMQTWDSGVQVIVDGYEQLSWWRRRQLQRHCRRQGCGLLVTTHRDLGLPDVYVTAPRLDLAQRVAARLLEGWPPLVQADDVARCFAAQGGDLRETFFALYDLYEARRPR